jgi:hypothetical protein
MTRESKIGAIPLEEDYESAEELVELLYDVLQGGNITEPARRDIWRIVTSMPWTHSRILRALPQSYEGFELVAEDGIRAAYQPKATRTIEDLQQNGRCSDSIRPQPSTIRQAGRGAFTVKAFQSGEIVAGTPLLFYPTNETFKMYNGNWFTKSVEELDPQTLEGYQLVLNYCWQHGSSSMVLCPYGSGINYINHNRSRANVRAQWAKNGAMRHDESLLQHHPSSMYYTAAPRLWLDIVATRDIGTNEELFMDYGDAWEVAWQIHERNWQADTFPGGYISAHDWNILYRHVMLRTVDEQESDPYPENFVLTCLPEIANASIADEITSSVAKELWQPDVVGWPCRIIEREQQPDGDYWYMVEYHEAQFPIPLSVDDDEYEIEWKESEFIVREAMRFQEAPYTGNLFLGNAFRHPIGFPDDLFPDAWRGVHLPPLPPRPNVQSYRQER